MSNAVLKFEIELTSINCGHCGGTYAINENYRKQCQTYARFWHCPYCQIGWGYGENELNKTRKELAAAKEAQRAAEAMSQRNLARANEEAAARAKAEAAQKRLLKNGVCPCCTRSFVNLRRHMQTKHPEVVK